MKNEKEKSLKTKKVNKLISSDGKVTLNLKTGEFTFQK